MSLHSLGTWDIKSTAFCKSQREGFKSSAGRWVGSVYHGFIAGKKTQHNKTQQVLDSGQAVNKMMYISCKMWHFSMYVVFLPLCVRSPCLPWNWTSGSPEENKEHRLNTLNTLHYSSIQHFSLNCTDNHVRLINTHSWLATKMCSMGEDSQHFKHFSLIHLQLVEPANNQHGNTVCNPSITSLLNLNPFKKKILNSSDNPEGLDYFLHNTNYYSSFWKCPDVQYKL